MNLKQQREAEGRYQKQVLLAAKAVDPRVDSGLYSKFENGIALPMPPVLQAICRFLHCKPSDIYAKETLDLQNCMSLPEAQYAKAKRTRPAQPKATFRLTDTACKSLDAARLAELGYSTKTEWFYEMIERTNREYAEHMAKKQGAATNRGGS